MAFTDKELEEQLLEAGNKLADPPSSAEELLPLLNQVESCLSRVEQSPTDTMQNALSSSLKALIADKLVRHTDDDVKVAVASCISEITRITAPEAPYDDDQMKEVFQLIVSSFENLHDKLSQSFAKRTSILETVAKVRSCVVMLDLECDALILEMFQHFFKAIREHHPENVFSSMETIMTLVLEESEDISLDLLSPLLASIKKNNEEVFPIAQKLGERVLESCSTKLKPYLIQAVKSLGISVDDYSTVLASICQDISDDSEKNDTCVTSEQVEDRSEPAKQSPEESTHVVKNDSSVVAPSQPENTDVNISPKSVMSNGVACVGEDNALADSESIKKQEDADCSNNSEGLNISCHEVHNDLDAEQVDQVVKKDSMEVAPSQLENTDVNISPKSVMSNGVACVGEDNALADSKSIKKQEDADCSNNSEGLNISGHEVHNDLDTEKVDNSKQKPKQATKRRRKKSSSSTKSAKPFKGQVASNEKETEKIQDYESNSNKFPSAPHKDHTVEAAGPPENDNEIDAKVSSPKACNDESEVVASPPSESLYDENHLKKLGRTKKKDGPVKDEAAEGVSKESGGASDSEAKPVMRSVKKALGQKSDLKKSSVVDSVKKGKGAANDADAKKHSAKKLDENKKGSSGSSSRQMEDKKKGRRGKANPETDVAKSSAMDVDKEKVSSPRSGTKFTKDENAETTKTNVKRKRSSGKENESKVKEYGENLVGLRVKVWWPEDLEFYTGVIDSFDAAKKKHKVLYDDGDEEALNLVKEKWKVIEADSDAEEEEQSDRASLDASTDMPPKKKGKRSAGESTKQGKMDASSRSGGAASSSRSKGASTKSSQKSKDGNKSKDSKTNSKPEDEVSRKSKASTPKSGSSKSIAAKKMSKSKNTDNSKRSESKDDDTSMSKPSAKSKQQETPKSGKSKQETLKNASSKGKSLKSGGKTDGNGTGKVKSGSLKRKYSENENSGV